MINKANFNYIQNIDNEKSVAEMYVYDQISDDKVNGSNFAYELRYLLNYHEPKPKEIKVRINSVGGGVMHAFTIFSSILNANKDSQIAVNTYNDGVAASSASFVLLAGKNIHVKDYSRLMLHGVLATDDEGNIKGDLSEKDKIALSNFSDMICEVCHKRTGISKEYIKELLTNGQDNWFTAQEGADAGFYPSENIENTGVELDFPDDLNTEGVTLVVNEARKIIKKNVKPYKMKNIIAALKLQEGSDESTVLNAVTNALQAKETAENKLVEAINRAETAEGKVTTLNTQLVSANKDAATVYVNAQITAGKFAPKDAAEKTNLINQYVKDPEGFKTMVNLMPTIAKNILDGVTGGEGAETLLTKVNKRSLRTLEKEDPSLLNQIKNEALPEYIKLYNEQYKTELTEEDFK